MATLKQLLATQPNPEGHIVVGGDRFITVPENLKRLGVQYDHNIETVTFDCPKEWDGEDLSAMSIYIIYARSDGTRGTFTERYPTTKVEIDESNSDVMHFNWTITRNVTEVAGPVSFMVCIMKTDDNGVEQIHWNSEICKDCYISPAMESADYEPFENVDVFDTYAKDLADVLKTTVSSYATTATNAKNAAETAAIDAQTTLNEINSKSDQIRNSYASAIKGVVSGDIIRIDDVSPIEHDVKCYVHGKNLFNTNKYTTQIDYGNNNKTIYAISADHLVIGRTYTVFSEVPMQWFKISNSATGYSCCGTSSNDTTGFTSYTFTHNRNPNILASDPLYIYVNNIDRTAMYDLSIMETMNVCLVEGSVVTEYEPYLDPTTVKLTRCRRNLFAYGTKSDYQHVGDITVNTQSIHCSVTSSNSSHVVNTTNKYPSGIYSLRFDYSDNAPRILLRLYNEDGSTIASNETLRQKGYQYNDAYKAFFKNGKEDVITISDDVAYWCLGFVFPVTDTAPIGSVKNVYGIRLEYDDGTNKYELYDGETIVPAADGTCVVTSKSPTMTLLTDTPGVTIEAEYNADTKTWVENYLRDNAPSGSGSAPWMTSISLPASKWVGENSPYSQVVTINGITNNSRVDLFPTVAQLAIFHEKDVSFVTENDNGKVTVYAIGDKPTNDYTMQVQITEVLR